jgi:hypothetical protein
VSEQSPYENLISTIEKFGASLGRRRAVELRCGAGVPELLKRTIPASEGSNQGHDYAAIRIISDASYIPGACVFIDQYGDAMGPVLIVDIPTIDE